MSRARLRVYYGPEETARDESQRAAANCVRLTLGELLPTLADAYRTKRAWLDDFQNEELTISMDLYEIILAYEHCRRPSA